MDKQYLIYSTVQIMTDTGEGTGFIMDLTDNPNRCIPVLITNKHVVEGCTDIEIVLTLQNNDGTLVTQNHKLINVVDKCVSHDKYDLCAIPLNRVLEKTYKSGQTVVGSFVVVDELAMATDLIKTDSIEDVYVVGYPNAFRDRRNNLPIARKGVTATPLYADYEGEKEFLVDCGILEGSSGSPVFIKLINGEYKLAGIIFAVKRMCAEVDYKNDKGEEKQGTCWIPTGIGVAIKAQEIMDIALKIYKIKGEDIIL